MPTSVALKPVIEELFPLHRTLVSDGTDQALARIGSLMPPEAGFAMETYPPGMPVWTWQVPERYVVHEAYLETEAGERIVDFETNALHLVSYSLPIDRALSWEELEPHLHYNANRPKAIPWEFQYYERGWGFCLSKEKFDALPRDQRYHAVIAVEFVTDPDQGLRVGVGVIEAEGGRAESVGELLICAHICHPGQANDDLSGVVTALEVARRLGQRPLPAGSMGVRFLFGPETIGSICYLSQHEEVIARLRGGIFCEMTGNRNGIALQRSRQDRDLMDRVALRLLRARGQAYREGAFRDIIGNDEMVINGPGVDVPCISISRWPYPEYHTSDDNPSIIDEAMLQDAADLVEAIVRVAGSNYRPRRTFRGPLFLSRYGLWVDWRVNKALNLAMEKILLRLDGDQSLFDIAEQLNLDYDVVREFVEKLRLKGLVEALPIPRRDGGHPPDLST